MGFCHVPRIGTSDLIVRCGHHDRPTDRLPLHAHALVFSLSPCSKKGDLLQGACEIFVGCRAWVFLFSLSNNPGYLQLWTRFSASDMVIWSCILISRCDHRTSLVPIRIEYKETQRSRVVFNSLRGLNGLWGLVNFGVNIQCGRESVSLYWTLGCVGIFPRWRECDHSIF